MWASLFFAGILSGWWGALALAAAPPANRNSLEETSTRTTSDHPPSMSIIEKPLDYRLPTWNFVTRTIDRRDHRLPTEQLHAPSTRDYVLPTDDDDDDDEDDEVVLPTTHREQLEQNKLHRQIRPSAENVNRYNSRTYRVNDRDRFASERISSTFPADHLPPEDASEEQEEGEELDDSIREAFVSSSRHANRHLEARKIHPKMEESGLTRLPRHTSTQTPFLYPGGSTESSVERPRVIRSAKQRPKNRTKADSPREQRRRCRNKGCRGQNWCPDVDVGNRAYLAPTVFEGKARSMSSDRKPGFNYAVTFEVKQVYKNQPGFQPLLKNDSVRLHFRDKSTPGKSTVCGYDTDGKQQQQQQRDNQSGVVRANIKRGKVYLVFVNRVGPRNFTILGEPVIRSKKNEQAVQAVVRPDYGE
ncbi:Protein vein [Habropoda laboriosa]|uniref:Protein vein n=2 Tax=Habropoda laboriosa TaxID=597456 RepID=A0A0L7RIQ1_9HYME|nr:Protein vein [Habropoda laboriosa]